MITKRLNLIVALCIMVITLCSCTNRETVDSPKSSSVSIPYESTEDERTVDHRGENELVHLAIQVPLMTDGEFGFHERKLEGDDVYEQYYHFTDPVDRVEAGRIFLMCTDETELNQGSHYIAYAVENDELVPLEIKQFSGDYGLLGGTVHVELEYVENDGVWAITYIASNSEATLDFNILDTSRGAKKCLIGFFCKTHIGTLIQYPVLLDLETGELTDFLSEIEQEKLFPMLSGQIYDSAMDDENRLVIKLSDGNYYYIDPNGNCCYCLTELISQEISDCALTQNAIICWNESGDYWQIALDTIEVKQILSDVDTVFICGISEGNGSSFVLYRDGGYLHSFDFNNMTDTLLTNIGSWEINSEDGYVSPDGRKLLVMQRENGIFQMGIFDCDTARFLSLARSNADGLMESQIYWSEYHGIEEVEIVSESARDIYNYRFS